DPLADRSPLRRLDRAAGIQGHAFGTDGHGSIAKGEFFVLASGPVFDDKEDARAETRIGCRMEVSCDNAGYGLVLWRSRKPACHSGVYNQIPDRRQRPEINEIVP